MSKTIVSVSKKNNSVWRMYFYDVNEDNEWNFYTERINPLLVWYYKLKKSKLCNNICDTCDNEFRFYNLFFIKSIDFIGVGSVLEIIALYMLA